MVKKIVIIISFLVFLPGCSNFLNDKNASLSLYDAMLAAGAPQSLFLINNGSQNAYNMAAFLVLNFTGGSEMCFSNDNISWSSWEPYRNITNWNLSAGNGLKTVHARIRKSSTEIITTSDTITYINKVRPLEKSQDMFFGHCVSLSTDGKILLSGSNSQSNGRAYIYKWNLSNWDEIELKRSSSFANDYFGTAVTINGNGDIAAVGAYGYSNKKGKVYIFKQNDIFANIWDEVTSVSAMDASDADNFGYSVAFSKDGSTLVVGSPGKDSGANLNTGMVYVFNKVSDAWMETFQLTAIVPAAENVFGSSVAVSSDGNVIAVSAPYASQNMGAVYIFRKSGGIYNQIKITAADELENNFFGTSLSMSDNGNVLASTSPGAKKGSNLNQGTAYIFEYNGTSWNQTALITASDGSANDHFGNSISISSNGEIVAIANSQKDESAGADAGAIYIYKKSAGVYSEFIKYTAVDGYQNYLLGSSVAISSDGTRITAGASGDSTDARSSGAVYVFGD